MINICVTILMSIIVGVVCLLPLANFKKLAFFSLIAISLLLIGNPFFSFILLIVARPVVELFRDYYIFSSLSLLGMFSLLNIVLVLYMFLRDRSFRFLIPHLKGFYLFILISIFSLANISDFDGVLVNVFKLISMASLFLLSYNLINKFQDIMTFLWAILVSAIFPIGYGFYQIVTQQGIIQDLTGYLRINSTFALSNPFAFFLGIVIFVAILIINLSRKISHKFICFGFIVCASICLVFTYVRAVWIALFCSLIFMLFFIKKLRVPILLCTLIFALFFSAAVVDRFGDIKERPSVGTNSLTFRLDITEQLLTRAVPNHLFLGFGLGKAEEVAINYTDYQHLPHNDYLRVLVETGLWGLLSYVFFIVNICVYFVRQLYRKWNFRVNILFLSVFLFYLIVSLGQNCFSYISVSGYVFCLLGIVTKYNELQLAIHPRKPL